MPCKSKVEKVWGTEGTTTNMIDQLDEHEFGEKLATVLRPARPVDSEELLHGRTTQLTKIRRAMMSPGQHVFIYGDRGVGKSSLAQTASALHQSLDLNEIVVSCSNETEFYGLVQDIARKLAPEASMVERKERTTSGELALGGLKGGVSEKVQRGIIPGLATINDAGQLLREVASPFREPVVVIVDEFDQLIEDRDKKLFADLIKHVSDTSVPIRFVFCGIGKSLQELIGVHLSTDRYLTPVELSPLSHDARWAILEGAAEALSVSVDRETLIRIGQISDGFPYYVHLIGQHMFWAAYEAQEKVTNVALGHFHEGVTGAIQDAQTSLRQAYEQATQKYDGKKQYEHVLWAVADSTDFQRASTEIFENSYLPICQRLNVDPVTKQTFHNRMNRLKSEAHGTILESPRRSWYQFKENMVRGYVRMRASQSGIELGADHHAARKAPTWTRELSEQ